MLSSANWLQIEPIGDVQVVRLTGAPGASEQTTEQLGVRLLRLVENLGFRRIVLNLGAVERCGSGMIGKLIAVQRRIDACGGRLVLCQVRTPLREKLMEVLKLSQVLRIYDDETEALKAL